MTGIASRCWTAASVAPHSSRITPVTRAVALGIFGVLGFSLTYPATVLALPAFGTAVTGAGRGALGLPVALAVLVHGHRNGRPLPGRTGVVRLAVVAATVVLAFPVLSSTALGTVPTTRAAVLTGLLPALVAVGAAWRSRTRASPVFWLAVAAGAVLVLAFAAGQGGGPTVGDAWMVAALVCAAAGHVEGSSLSREIGGAAVISWALVLAAPITVPALVGGADAASWVAIDVTAVAALVWLGAVSCSGAFVAWYRALSQEGVATIGQLQLLQPVLTITAAAALLGEPVPAGTWATACGVLLTVSLAFHARPAPPPPT
jgi:drug/metabolite transporter (DMT)-like permease